TIIEQNPWWVSKDKILEDGKIIEAFSRKNKILYTFKEKSNLLFIGPRQVGKTTFFKLLIYDLLKKIDPKRILYFSCETLRNFEDIIEIVRRADFLLGEGEKFIFLDEISFVEGWERAIKYVLDSPLSKNKIFYLTGSSSIALKKESFPGRNIKVEEFLPFTFHKFVKLFGSKELKNIISFSNINFKEIFDNAKKLMPFKEELDKLFYRYLECGGFPRAFYELMEEGKIKEETYEIYWESLIHEIARIGRSEKIASGILIGIIKNYQTKFSLSSIAKEVEIGSHVTVREYLEILEKLLALRNVYTFDINKNRVVYRKMRKAYFLDPFIFHASYKKLFGEKVEDNTKLVEGIVFEALARRINNEMEIGFYHDKKEIDICFKDFGVEVKFQESVKESDFPKVPIKNKILISKNQFDFIEKRNLLIIPASIFLAMV
ncbi:MAG: ATP-binding protein, partial [Candidatus Micrarchaeales archaeon]